MDRSAFLFQSFLSRLPYEPTSCQQGMLHATASFLTSDDGDILVVNGYAGTGKTTAVSAVVSALDALEVKSVLLAPTGRAAKVLSQYTGRPASTIHKHIYRQKSFEGGFGQFSLSPNKARNTLFVVDEVSLIGISSEGGSAFGTGDLLADLVDFVRAGVDCRLILIGDAAQLPPVGLDASPALSPEYMAVFGGVSFVTLTSVVRQAQDSGILVNATHLREVMQSGDCDAFRFGLDGFPDIVRVSGGELLETLSDAYARYGEDEVIVLSRSNKRAGRYNLGIRAQVLYRDEQLVRGDKLMVVKNHYLDTLEGTDYIANGDIATLVWIRHFEERYGLHFADACLAFPDYSDQEVEMKVLLDTLTSDAPSLPYEQSQALYEGVLADYAHLTTKKKRYEAVRSDPFYSALQIKYAHAITGHKSQGGQWSCVFIDNPVWQDFLTEDDLKWLYTALTRATTQVYLVNFPDRLFL